MSCTESHDSHSETFHTPDSPGSMGVRIITTTTTTTIIIIIIIIIIVSLSIMYESHKSTHNAGVWSHRYSSGDVWLRHRAQYTHNTHPLPIHTSGADSTGKVVSFAHEEGCVVC